MDQESRCATAVYARVAIPVTVLAQRAEYVATLTWNQMTIPAARVTIDLADSRSIYQPPLGESIRTPLALQA